MRRNSQSTHPTTAAERNELRYYALGLASAVFVMAFFGTMWGLWASSVIQPGTASVLYYCLVGLIALALVASGLWLIRTVRRLPREAAPMSRQHAVEGRRYGIVFGIIFGLEGLFIGIASYVCSNILHNENALVPVTAIIVGLHFLPLARLFQVWPYYVTGAVLTLLGLVTLLVIPTNAVLGAGYAWIGVPGIGSALTLYATGLVAWFIGRDVAYGAAGRRRGRSRLRRL